MTALEMHQVNSLRHEFKRLLGAVPSSWRFESPNTLSVRMSAESDRLWLTTYPDGVLKFDDLLAAAFKEKATRLYLGE